MIKNVIFLLVSMVWLNGISAVAQEEREKAAIKTVVAHETEAYFGVDRKAWTENWLPVPYAYWSYSDSTGTNFVDGWKNIDSVFNDYFLKQKPSRSKITYQWQEIRVYGTGAYVRFVQRVVDEIDTEVSSQMRVLEKKDGKWKMICMDAVAQYPPRK